MADVPAAPPPPGPGVQPPFVVAPVEGRRARTWLGLGLAGGVLAVCCGVGVAAVGGLLVLGERAVNEQAQAAVDDYLAAVVERDWQQAYELRCAADRRAESLPEFRRRVSAGPQIETYEIGEIAPQPGDELFSSAVTVPVQVAYADGTRTRLTVPLDQDPQTGQLEVCGTVETG